MRRRLGRAVCRMSELLRLSEGRRGADSRRRIGDAAAESVREKYSIGFFARSVLDVYETAHNKRKTKEVKRNA